MNMAQTMAKVHKVRDDEIFNHITTVVDDLLTDRTWALSGDSYRRSDDNVFTYTFAVDGILKTVLMDGEKAWVSHQIKDRLAKYYYDQGFESSLTPMDELQLRFTGNDIGTTE